MMCHNCKTECRRFGRTRKGQQRYQCCQCRKTYSDPRNEHLGGMYTDPEKVEAVVTLLVEGCPIRSIQRITGVDQNTVTKILVLAGDKALDGSVRKKLRKVLEKKLAVDPEAYGLPLCGPLANYWKHQFGSHRIIYRIYREHRVVVVCAVGTRKQGEAEDIYRQLESVAKTGRLAEQVASVLRNLVPRRERVRAGAARRFLLPATRQKV